MMLLQLGPYSARVYVCYMLRVLVFEGNILYSKLKKKFCIFSLITVNLLPLLSMSSWMHGRISQFWSREDTRDDNSQVVTLLQWRGGKRSTPNSFYRHVYKHVLIMGFDRLYKGQ